jgi:hypothetical protein
MRKRENEYEGRLTAGQMCQSKSTKGATQGRIAWLAILSVISAGIQAGSSKVLHAIASVFFRVFAQPTIYKLPANDARPLRRP